MCLGSCSGNECSLGGVLRKEEYLESENQNYRMVLRSSGNLEILCGKVLIWASNTCDSRIDRLFFKYDESKSWDYIVALGESDSSIKWILHGDDYYTQKLILQNDGNLVLYSSHKPWYNPNGVVDALDTYGKCSNGENLVYCHLNI